MPVVSVSIAEEEVKGIGAENIAGQLVAWNYYQTTDSAGEREVRRGLQGEVRRRQGHLRPDGGRLHRGLPVEGGGREGRQRPTSRRSRRRPKGITFEAPEGKVTIDGENQHIYKTARIGVIAVRRPDQGGLELRRADQARPVPQGLRLGQGPVVAQRRRRRQSVRAMSSYFSPALHRASASVRAAARSRWA